MGIDSENLMHYNVTPNVDRLVEESSVLHEKKSFRNLVKEGLVRHVVDTDPDNVHKLASQKPQFSCCLKCRRVGTPYSLCPVCNRHGITVQFLPCFAGDTRVYINPRLLAKAFGRSTVAIEVPEEMDHSAHRLCFRQTAACATSLYSGPQSMLTLEAYDRHLHQVSGSRPNDPRRHCQPNLQPIEQFVRALVHGSWNRAWQIYKHNASSIGHRDELYDIDFIANTINTASASGQVH